MENNINANEDQVPKTPVEEQKKPETDMDSFGEDQVPKAPEEEQKKPETDMDSSGEDRVPKAPEEEQKTEKEPRKQGTDMDSSEQTAKPANRKKYLILGLVGLLFAGILGAFGIQQYQYQQSIKNYDQAVELYDKNQFEEAYDLFSKMSGYKDSSEKAESCATAIAVQETGLYSLLWLKVYGSSDNDHSNRLGYEPDNKVLIVFHDSVLPSREEFLEECGPEYSSTNSNLINPAERSYNRFITKYHTQFGEAAGNLEKLRQKDEDFKELGVRLSVIVFDKNGDDLLVYLDGELIAGSEYEYIKYS